MLVLAGVCACGKDDIPAKGGEGNGSGQVTPAPKPEEQKPGEGQPEEQRPSDVEMAMRGVAEWRVKPEVYYKALDIEALEQSEALDFAQLRPLVRLYMVSEEGKTYDFTEDDLAKVALHEVRYSAERGELSFRLVYNGVKGRDRVKLEFSREEYYACRFEVNTPFVSGHYMQGVFRHAEAFLGDLMTYDTERYLPELHSKGDDARRNSMSITFKIYDRKTNRDLGVFVTKDFSGFKSLESLLSALEIYSSVEVHDLAVAAMSKYKEGTDLVRMLAARMANQKWMQKMEYATGGVQLDYSEEKSDAHSPAVEVIKGQQSRLDVFLSRPQWRLKRAEVVDRDLHLGVALEMVNGVYVENRIYEIVIPHVVKK